MTRVSSEVGMTLPKMAAAIMILAVVVMIGLDVFRSSHERINPEVEANSSQRDAKVVPDGNKFLFHPFAQEEIDVRVEPVRDLGPITLQKLLEARVAKVKATSFLLGDSYQPSRLVFGSLSPDASWRSAAAMVGGASAAGGPADSDRVPTAAQFGGSEDVTPSSLQLLNPLVLVVPVLAHDYPPIKELVDVNVAPTVDSVTYYPKRKYGVIRVDLSRFLELLSLYPSNSNDREAVLQLSAVNARDFGFTHARAKAKKGVKFTKAIGDVELTEHFGVDMRNVNARTNTLLGLVGGWRFEVGSFPAIIEVDLFRSKPTPVVHPSLSIAIELYRETNQF